MIRHMVAIDSNRGIAKDGLQPWKLLTDEQYFREQTKHYGGIVLMGRKTFEVIGTKLPLVKWLDFKPEALWAGTF